MLKEGRNYPMCFPWKILGKIEKKESKKDSLPVAAMWQTGGHTGKPVRGAQVVGSRSADCSG